MANLPTDLEILNLIYDQYYDQFVDFSKDNPTRSAKIYVPIDIDKIASEFSVDGDIIFGRFYYHLNKKFGYKNDDESLVPFFSKSVGDDKHCVNFPLLASVLSDLRKENRKFWTATSIAIISLIVSIVSILISLLA